MKKITFSELVAREPRLSSLYGNVGLEPYSLIVYKEAVKDDDKVRSAKRVAGITGEKIYNLDKGWSAISRLFEDYPSESIIIPEKYRFDDVLTDWEVTSLEKIEFEMGVNVYKETITLKCWNSIHTHTEYLINVRSVELPKINEVEISDSPRIYVVTGKDGKFYKLPMLQYPDIMSNFVKWLKKKKKIKFSVDAIWNKSANFEKLEKDPMLYWKWCSNGYLIKNLKNDKDIILYNAELKTESFKRFKQHIIKEASIFYDTTNYYAYLIQEDLPLIDVDITQDDINEFVGEQNGPIKITK